MLNMSLINYIIQITTSLKYLHLVSKPYIKVQKISQFQKIGIQINIETQQIKQDEYVRIQIIILKDQWRQKMNKNNPCVLTYVGHFEGKISGTISEDKKYLITLGVDDLIIMWDTSDMTSRKQIQLSNKTDQTFSCIDYNQRDETFVLGSISGLVKIVNKLDTSNEKIIYQCQNPISSIKFSSGYRYLAISSNQQRGILYDNNLHKIFKCDVGHQAQTYYADVVFQEKIMVTIGNDGYAIIYQILPQAINPIRQLARYKICPDQQIRAMVNFSERPNNLGHISFAGSTTLQQIFIHQNGENANNEILTQYRVKVEIREEQQIRKVCWVNQNILVIVLDKKVVLWNYVTKTRFHALNNHVWSYVISGVDQVFGLDSSAIIYKYQSPQNIKYQNEQSIRYLQNQKSGANNQKDMQEKPEQIQQEQIRPIKKKAKKRTQISKATKLITKEPQGGIQSFYEKHLDNQIMIYNQHGCVIKRTDQVQEIMQLQYHDKFKLSKIKFQKKGKVYYYFALTQNCFMYADLTSVHFEMENNRQKKNQSDSLLSRSSRVYHWSYMIDNVEGVAIGNSWAAVVSKIEIRIFDFSGNQLHCISHDRKYMAVAAHEDLLAIAYSSSLPIGESNLFQVKFYTITPQKFKLIRKTNMPVKCYRNLKWFGFSFEGCLFNQDSSSTIRMYMWDHDEWIDVYEEDYNKYSIFIQHIENYQLYAFRIQLKEGEPACPTLVPRCLPRKMQFNYPKCRLKYLTDQQNKRLQSIYLRRLRLQQEKFRSERWFKYKYSRRPDNHMFKYSYNIKSPEQIEQLMTQMDINVVQQISKLLQNIKKRLSEQEVQQFKAELLAICQNILYYQQSFSKVNKLLGITNMLQNMSVPVTKYPDVKPVKYSRINRLQLMADRGWIYNQISAE